MTVRGRSCNARALENAVSIRLINVERMDSNKRARLTVWAEGGILEVVKVDEEVRLRRGGDIRLGCGTSALYYLTPILYTISLILVFLKSNKVPAVVFKQTSL